MTGRKTRGRQAPVRLIAHGKVNLTLAVLGRRLDGYHDLASVFLRIGLGDGLTVTPAPANVRPSDSADAGDDRLVVRGDPRCPVDDNLVLRAASLLRAGRGSLPPLGFELTKRIPVASGLGGGSSDAAAALLGCATAWGLALDPVEQLELAARLGSDVPFFASGAAAALVTGRGERLESLPPPSGALGLLIVVSGQKPGTGAVFAELASHGPDGGGRGPSPGGGPSVDDRPTARGRATSTEALTHRLADRLRSGLSGGELAAMAGELCDANDLWPAAARLVPAFTTLRQALEKALARPVLLSGAGPALVALYPSVADATDAAARLASVPLPADSATIIAADLVSPIPTWRTP